MQLQANQKLQRPNSNLIRKKVYLQAKRRHSNLTRQHQLSKKSDQRYVRNTYTKLRKVRLKET